jgi:2-aminoethylphosphonate-pyruvate transaminase
MFDPNCIPDNPYLLLTPGPLSTTKRVKSAMLQDWCTWEKDYNDLVQDIRARLVSLATGAEGYTSILMQGSGTFSVEAAIGTVVPAEGKLLVLANGVYGRRMASIARRLGLQVRILDCEEDRPFDVDVLDRCLAADGEITHVAMVHCETTTGLLNPVEPVGQVVKYHGRIYLVDAMSSFGGIPFDLADLRADFLISSANKCLQGVPGLGLVLASVSELEKCRDRSRSLSLDLYDQWQEMETKGGKWRFTSPTHVVRALAEALAELDDEGGIVNRYRRYGANQKLLVKGMRELGFRTYLADEYHSPIITSFKYPDDPSFVFERFYRDIKDRGFVIYPGKVSNASTFRIGSIGDISPADMEGLLAAVGDSR